MLVIWLLRFLVGKQRLGIARALYINPKVLIFDEATSSLDIDNENKIIEIIKRYKKNKTIILVSHRSNTLKYCDKIYEIKKGTISEKKLELLLSTSQIILEHYYKRNL